MVFATCHSQNGKGLIMLKITDKSFRYTTSFQTDLKKKFRQLAREQRQAVEDAKIADVAASKSVVPLDARRVAQKGG